MILSSDVDKTIKDVRVCLRKAIKTYWAHYNMINLYTITLSCSKARPLLCRIWCREELWTGFGPFWLGNIPSPWLFLEPTAVLLLLSLVWGPVQWGTLSAGNKGWDQQWREHNYRASRPGLWEPSRPPENLEWRFSPNAVTRRTTYSVTSIFDLVFCFLPPSYVRSFPKSVCAVSLQTA